MRTILATLHSKYIHPSLALPYLAAYCGEECGEILIREFTVHEPKENVLAALISEEPDVVAFSVYLWNRRETLELVDALAVARPQLRIVLGGPEVSFENETIFRRHEGLSALVYGEGELPLKSLLSAWIRGEQPQALTRLSIRREGDIVTGADGAPLNDLDTIPSPFERGLVDTSRGFVYYETSRGCPYRCAFCMSALDDAVRSFSMARIESDLLLLLQRETPKIKFVDRTFNYDAGRARHIFSFILAHNRVSHCHFEVGAHLLDEETLALLETVPPGMFQFEIGVQSTLPGTLSQIDRGVSLQKLEANVLRLRRAGNIHLHLDLIAGLPGEGYGDVLDSIDRVAALRPHHLQLEPVKLLPGSPLRSDADTLGIRFDPNPPYTVLTTAQLGYAELERLRIVSRLLDLTYNSGRFDGFLQELLRCCGSLAAGLEQLADYWQQHSLFRHPLSQRSVFEQIWSFVCRSFVGAQRESLREQLGRDFARSERVVPEKAPAFLDTALNREEEQTVRKALQNEVENIKGRGIKLQHFAAVFERLPELEHRTVLLFLYLSRSGEGMQVREIRL